MSAAFQITIRETKSCLNELNQAQAPSSSLRPLLTPWVIRWPSLGSSRVWDHFFDNESPICIPLDSCPYLWLLFICCTLFMIMERCHGPLEGNSRSGGQSPALASSSASHGFHDPGQGTSPEPQPHHLKSRNNDISPTHLAGLWGANRQIKYLKALSKPCISRQEILMKPMRPLHVFLMQIRSLLFLFSWSII